MKNYTFHSHFFLFSFFCVVFFGFLSTPVASANNYQKIAPGDTVTLGEFVFDDDFVATTTDCWIGIKDPLDVEIVASTTLMTANSDGWHYYNYTTAVDAPSGTWPSVMICGTAARGDLVKVDKSFIVDSSLVSTSTIKEVVDESLTVATTSLAAVINANTDAQVLAASTSLATSIPTNVWNATTRSLTTFGSLVTDVTTGVWNASTRSLTTFGTLVADITSAVWGAGTRTLTGFGTLVADVWTNTTRTLTGADLDSGSLATLSDIETATSSVASAISAGTAAVNSNTDAQLLAASTSLATFINNNSNATILAASTSLASFLSAHTDAASSSIASFINANTNSTVLAASTSLAAFINANTDSQISGAVTSINTNTDAQVLAASTSLATSIPINVWNATTRSLTTFGTLVADITSAVWGAGTRTLTGFGTLAADIWTSATRTLTGANLDSGSLATLSDIQTATSSLAAVINTNTNSQISNLTTEVQSGYTVTLSDFGETNVNTAYKAKLQVLNHATTPTDADSLPTVDIIDSVGTVQVSGAAMTKDSAGTYSYSYSIGGSAVGGVWETIVSTVINGQTVKVNDYWSLAGSPADVVILEITDKVIPTITASVRIDNKGTSGSDFYYVYCIVDSVDNLCGGGDDIDSASATSYINAGDYINLSLTLDDVPAAGTYWFKITARALAETLWAASTEQFTAESGIAITPPPAGGGGGGGGGGMATVVDSDPTPTSLSADLNLSGNVGSVDFSILLFYWKTSPPFANPRVDINGDGKVDSVDFSIMLYQWGKTAI